MSDLNLHLIISGDPSSLEQVLQCSCENGQHVKSFTAELNPRRNQYEIKMCVSGVVNQHQVVGRLAELEHIRELSPLRSLRLL